MVGHTGSLPAAIAAIKAVDGCLARVIPAILAADGAAIVTADHGNAELMWDYELNAPHTAHTTNLVPYIFVKGPGEANPRTLPPGALCDLAPTMIATYSPRSIWMDRPRRACTSSSPITYVFQRS